MAFGGSGGAGVRADINITPLVDVVLVLLIIFMVMTPTLLKEVDVRVPAKAEVTTEQSPSTHEVVVAVAKDGALTINREPIVASDFGDRVRELMAARAEKRVFFEVDDEAPYGEAVHAMDVCRGAGAKTLGLSTRTP